MKPPTNRRKFLAFVAATTASLGFTWKSFGYSPTYSSDMGNTGNEGNVRLFGATGDGKTDDTAAVQKAIDAGTGAVFFPRGHYRITRTLQVELDEIGHSSIRGEGSAQLIMEGPGPAFKIMGTHLKSAAPQTFSDDVWDRQRMPLVDGLAIRGDHPEAVGIEAVGTMQLTISRVHVRNAQHGLHLTGNNRNLIVSDCHFYENGGIGIYYDEVNLHQSNITGCHISYNHGGGIVSRGGNVRNIHITGCDIESNMGEKDEPTANILIDCSTSQSGTAEVAITGCTIQHNSVSPNAANIRILGSGKSDQNTGRERWGNVTITGNILSDVMVNLHLQDCRGVAISGNTAWSGYDHNLLLINCSNIVLGSNVFDMNPNYRGKDKAKNSLVVSNCEDSTISGLQINNVQDQAGLLIKNSRRMNITNCTILDCDKVGLLLRNVSHSRVSGCLIRNDLPGSQFTPLETIGGEDNVILEDLPI